MGDRLVSAAIMAAMLMIAGCAGENPSVASPDGDGVTRGAAPDQVAGMVDCGGSVYDPDALADAPLVSSLPEGPAGAVDDAGDPAFDPSQDWRVAYESDDRVDLIRELPDPVDQGGGDLRTHESRTVERLTGSVNVPDGTWMLMSAGPCSQRIIVDDDLGDADLTLARTPSADETTLELWVHERACASGQSADGRIEVVELTETADQIRLHVVVQTLGGDQDCQGNPSTRFTVELTEPLGERQVVDASVVPVRAVTFGEPADAG